jgi:molybdopterin converting factor subunit 1
MIQLKVLVFATLRDRVSGKKSIEIEIEDGTTVEGLKKQVARRFPALKTSMESVLVAVNREYAFDELVLEAGMEVAMFPPVSGGTGLPTVFSITDAPLDLDALLAQITLPTTGAAALFSGLVRGVTSRGAAHETEYLEYEAYRPMAEGKMRQIADEIRRKWPSVEGIALVQRVGRLFPGTPTVLIACTAAHRDTGVFEAARYGIDRLKEIVPVWKKEVSPSGEFWVEGEHTPAGGK